MTKQIPRIFIGTDPRSVVSAWVLASSITRHASGPVAITQLIGEQTPIKRNGLTSFTFARWFTAGLVDYTGGPVLFMDSDIIVRGDIYELFDQFDDTKAVQVIKNKERFEWAAVMLFNAEKCTALTADYINHPKTMPQKFDWLEGGYESDLIGELTPEWGHLVDYDPYSEKEPKLIHYTTGTPAFLECRNCDYAAQWQEEMGEMLSTCSWLELMGRSVHTKIVQERMKHNEHTYLSKQHNKPVVQRTMQISPRG